MIQSILSGKFLEPYAYTYYLSNELGIILSLLYSFFPKIPWLGVFFASVYFFSGIVIINKIVESTNSINIYFSKIIATFCIFVCLFFSNYIMMTYTIVAAIPVACGVFLLFFTKNKRDYFLIFLMFFISYLIRDNIFFISFPFIALALILKRKKIKSDLNEKVLTGRMIFCFIILFLILFLVNEIVPTDLEWNQYKNYNNVRTEVYDYVNIYPDRDEAVEYYLDNGVSYEEILLYYLYDMNADIIGNYLNTCMNAGLSSIDRKTVLNNSISKSFVKLKIFAGYNNNNNFIYRLIEAVNIYFTKILTCGSVIRYHIFVGGIYIIFIIDIFLKRKYRLIMIPGILFIIRSVIWIYLAWIDRYPDRVLISTLIIEAMIIIALIYENFNDSSNSELLLFRIACAIFLVISLWSFSGTIKQYYAEMDRISQDDTIYSYMKDNSDENYLIDLYSVVNHSEYVFNGYDYDYENYMILGCWIVGHPLMNKKILMNENYKLIVKNDCLINAGIISEIMEQEIIPLENVNNQYTVFELHSYE